MNTLISYSFIFPFFFFPPEFPWRESQSGNCTAVITRFSLAGAGALNDNFADRHQELRQRGTAGISAVG